MSLKQRKHEISLLFLAQAQYVSQRTPESRTTIIVELEKIDKEILTALDKVGFQERFLLSNVLAAIGTIELSPENVQAMRELLEKKKIASVKTLDLVESVVLGGKE